MNSKKIYIAAAAFLYGFSQAQQTSYYTDRKAYKTDLAEHLYETKIYSAAQYEYAQQYFYNATLSESEKEAAQFFDNVIGVILQKNHAEEGLNAFIQEYPNSAYFAQANLPLSDYYLAKKDFSKALESLNKVNQYQLSKEENTQYILKLGYAKYMTGDAKGAKDALEEAYQNAGDGDKNDVSYMLGHLYYADGQNEKAFGFFDAIKSDVKYADKIRPYYVQLYYNQKDYDRAISEGIQLLNYNLSDSYKAEIHKIIGESYFMKQDYSSAEPHLKIYLENQQNPSDKDLYEMGFVSAKNRRYDDAVLYYNRLLNSNSEMAQNAYYQLGNAYLQTGKKQEALSAFRSAYQMNYDANIQKFAHEQYAKLSYEIGNPFETPALVIQEYAKKYPRSEKTPELNKLLVKSYLYSGNYKETLEAIDKLPNSSAETDKIDQEVSFLLGTEEFNKGNLDEAEKYFKRSLKFNFNTETNSRAQYWLAQTSYQKADYSAAISGYERLLPADFPEKQQLSYDLGYAYYKQKDFGNAEKYFKNYLQNPKPEFQSDAELRLADIYFADNKLADAIAIYEKYEGSTDYSLFQKALALGFKGETDAKISNLKALISKYPSSEYVDDANFEIATAFAGKDDFTASNEYFNKVIKNSNDPNLIANAQIYRAQNLADLGQGEKALAELKSLGSKYKNTSFASKIALASRPIYIKNNDVSGYKNFAESLGINVGNSEIDEINLNSAKNFYAKKEYKNAIPLYEKFLVQNPSGDALYQAKYELGESYFQTKDTTKALLVFQEVGARQNDYQEDAQTRIAQIYLSQDNYVEAKKYLEPLSVSGNPAVRSFANVELAKIYAEEKDFPKAEKAADAVLQNSKNSTAVNESAKAIKARALMNAGRDRDAQQAYAALEKSTNPEVAAEAVYARAFYQNKAKAFKASNETIFKLANNYASEEFWGAKALLVMAKNYIGLKDRYQASYTVDQILANYQDFPDIIAEAKGIKKNIK